LQKKHSKIFKIALKLGLNWPMCSGSTRSELKFRLKKYSKHLGPYPHSKLSEQAKVVDRWPRPRAKCSECGFTVPMLKAFIHYGPPICPKDKIEMTAIWDWEE
jgi:hypothetical protein